MRKPSLLFCLSVLPVVYGVTIDLSIIGKTEDLGKLAAATSGSLEEIEGSVEYGLEGEGYHRDLVVTLKRQGRGRGTDWIVVVNVTSQFYIDLDQISQMAAFGGPDLISSGHINTEQNVADSGSHIVLVYVTMRGSETEVKVPLHLRYQATGSTPYSAAIIPTPHLLMKVPEGLFSPFF
ncbi:hypothetical protein GBAR_LOCUS29643 [Geodia barretti]|uniref:Phosphatidylinositol-glycan biosynthesis class X protein n=1 Tax=Geodia barretti TaxID=519541 RepID=A0AA35TWB6_GEOBA|nr:hypothetical protein GBAR_LOCUS29643 [Geodia barretti]